MERSHPSSGRFATPAAIIRNGRPTSFGIGGRHQSECPADIIGIRRINPSNQSLTPLQTGSEAEDRDITALPVERDQLLTHLLALKKFARDKKSRLPLRLSRGIL